MVLTSDFLDTKTSPQLAQIESLFDLPQDQRGAATTAILAGLEPSLLDWLVRSHAVLIAYFGSNAKFVLEAVDDPDVTGATNLVVYIMTRLAIDEAKRKLDAFDNDWFFDQIDMVGNKIFFNLAFV